MSPMLDRLTAEDPVALVQSCHSALLWILRSHQSQPIPRFWIDHPYGEEEITLLEEELLPALEAFLARTGEIDAGIEAAHEAEVERVQAAMAAEALALA
ncbi:hypothetical protein KBZ20_17355 [Vulcanococcus limneticus Candia 3F8]|uniref:hypothetical protein n=1 Tax=Vulcanococcus limneticus TaxID=2170428 RepID=UPI0020CBA39A|nr:hypothetical protein [Vulcanococcus limneticus]MCP9793382.1 hypothetical protein [Vulcanococcus limneticus MW73D5]MCP9895530.1 hypothetical protein [Vulcanococcus limneticus Candia 3F8]MCP9898793.1 hypothetical protein [Vulcanococcus limneticus Candia 3B3]